MSRPKPATIRVLRRRGTPVDGITMLRADLAGVFRAVPRVGRDPALLLLTIRALRQRGGGVQLRDLTWMLGAPPRRIRSWLDRLAAAELIVYDATNGTIDVELTDTSLPAWSDVQPPHLVMRHDVPTHWFIHVLPRLGRPTFLTYLYLLSRDGISAPAAFVLSALTRDAGLASTMHARLYLRRLRQRGLVENDPSAHGLVIRDPPPLTPAARWRLRLRRRYGYAIARWLSLAAVILVLAALLLAVLLMPPR